MPRLPSALKAWAGQNGREEFTGSNARQASVNSHLYNLYSETPKEGGHPLRRRPATRESPPKGEGPRQRTRAASRRGRDDPEAPVCQATHY
eukprot:scaffold9626_cov114-Isochrysis_galbana.AAC.2